MDDGDEKSFCYIEGTTLDKNASDDLRDFHENVWYRVKPPRQTDTLHPAFVTARQIDLVRTILLGKTALKTYDFKSEFFLKEEKTECEKKQNRRDNPPKASLKNKKSSVKFLNQSIYE